MIQAIDDRQFDRVVETARVPVLVEFWQPGCGGCRALLIELEKLAAERVTDVTRIAQAARRAVGKWVGEAYRRQPMIVPTVLEI